MVSNGLCLELGVWYMGEEGMVLEMSFLLFLSFVNRKYYYF